MGDGVTPPDHSLTLMAGFRSAHQDRLRVIIFYVESIDCLMNTCNIKCETGLGKTGNSYFGKSSFKMSMNKCKVSGTSRTRVASHHPTGLFELSPNVGWAGIR